MKRWPLIAGGLILAGAATIWIAVGGEQSNTIAGREGKGSAIQVNNEVFNTWISETVQNDLYLKGEGKIDSWYPYEDSGFLIETKTERNEYDETFKVDRVGWIVREDQEYDAKWLTTGEQAIQVVKENNSPYIKDGNNTWILLVKKGNDGKAEKASVYAVYDDVVKKSYETKGEFLGIERTKGKLMIVEKRHNMQSASYPPHLKPYTEYRTSYTEGEWSSKKGKEVTPGTT